MSAYDEPHIFIREQLEAGPVVDLHPYQRQALEALYEGKRLILAQANSAGTRRWVEETIARYSELTRMPS